TRLIHVGSDTSEPRLSPSQGECGKYVALSQVCGSYTATLRTSSNQEQKVSGIPLESPPKTFREAGLVTRFLDISYLWIDRLCIIQGDNNHDWHQESAKIAYIYFVAIVTISADN
ncbi:hypothetical protein BJ170DRAFT_585783, partial [Xylariales sp. AK1849]